MLLDLDKINIEIHDRTAEFLLSELTFEEVKNFINSSSTRRKKVSSGGFRIIKQNFDSICRKLIKVVEDEEVLELFFSWYNHKSEYKNFLDSFFHSEEYIDLAKKENIKEGTYILTDIKFNEFLCLVDPVHYNQFLYFSPILFSDYQYNIINNITRKFYEKETNIKTHFELYKKEKKNLLMKQKNVETNLNISKKKI